MKKENRFKLISLSILKAILYFGIWFALQIVVAAVMTVAITVKHPGMSENSLLEFINSSTVGMMVVTNSLCIIVLALICKLGKSTLSEKASINKYPSRFTLNSIIMGVAFAFAVAFILGVLYNIGIFPDSWVDMQEENGNSITNASAGMVFLFTVIMAPLLEEILFRGMILGALKEAMHPWVAITISAVMFGVAHGTPIGIIYATSLGFVMGWLAVRLNSIIPSIAFHIAYNATISYAEETTYFVILASVPILIFEIIDINRFYRGKKQ